MSVEIATAYVSLVVSAEGILDNIRSELAPLDDAFAQAGITAGQQLGAGISSELQSALADAFAQPLDTSGLIDESAIGAQIDAGVSGAAPALIPVEGDTSSLDAALADALDAPRDVTVDGDTSALDAAIADATAVTADVPVDGDTSALASAVDEIFAAPQTVEVNADTQAADDAIGALSGLVVGVEVDADTSSAQDSIDGLAASATKASGGGGGEGLAGLEGAVLGLKAASGAAQGEVGGLSAGLGGISGSAGLAIGGLTAFAGLIGEATSKAADAEAQNKLFANTFGDVADKVKQIDVGGLVISLDDLGKQSGTTNANLEASATRIGLLGNASGAAKPQIAGTASDLLGIAGALAVSNPRLGDAASVADTLSRAFSTGRTRALIPYGISLGSTAIQTEALRENVGKTAADLTGYDKIVAGVTLTQQQFGDTLGTKFASGAQNAQVQLRALKVQLDETLVAVGGPLLAPLIASLKDVLPIAQETGIALGELAQAVLPLVAALAPALTPLAGLLHLVGDGLGVISSAIHALPTPVLIGGLLLVGPAAIEAATGVNIFTAALDINPVILAITAGLALLGAAVDIFGSKAPAAGAEAKDMGDFFRSAATDTSIFASGVHSATQEFSNFLDAQDKAGKLGGLDKVLQGSQASLQDVARAVSGTSQQFNTLQDSLVNTSGFTAQQTALLGVSASAVQVTGDAEGLSHAQEDAVIKANLVASALDQQRDAFVQNADGILQGAKRSGELTQAQLDQAEAIAHATTGVRGYGAALDFLNSIIGASIGAEQKANLTRSESRGTLQAAIAAFNPAKDSVAAYTANLVSLGVTQADADKLAGDQVAALQATTDKTILASSAVTDLNLQFVQGKIGAGQLEGGVFSLGTSMAAASGDVSDLQKDIDSFATSAVGALPKTGDAVTSFSSGVTKAFGDLVSAAKGSPAEIAKAQAALTAALDPATFVASLDKEAAAIGAFQKNLTTLVSEGLGALAGVIGAKGSEVGGQLAAVYANDHTKAIAADGAVQLVNTATGSFNTFAHGPAAAAAMGAGGEALMTAANARAAATFNLTHPIQSQVDQAKFLIAANEPGLSAVAQSYAQSGVVAFEQEFGRLPTITEFQTGKTADALTAAQGPLGSAASGAAVSVTGDFSGGLGLSGATTGALTDSQNAWSGQTTIDTANSARIAGGVVGAQFDLGLRDGINNPFYVAQINTAGANAAQAAVKGAKSVKGFNTGSPSKVGIEIGGQFVAGIGIGITNTDLGPEAAAAATTIATTFADALAQTPLVVTPVVNLDGIRKAIAAVSKPVTIPATTTPTTGGTFGTTAQIDAATKRLQELIATEAAQKQATTQTNAANTALQQLISTAVNALPTAATAIQAFSSAVSSATSTAASNWAALSKAQHSYNADVRAVHDANATVTQDLATFNSTTGPAHVAALQALGKAYAAQTAAEQAAATALGQLGSAQKTNAEGQKALADASNPAKFIEGLRAQNAQISGFSKDMKILAGEGLAGLVDELATLGPNVAKGLADALVKSTKDAKAAELLIDAGKSIATQLSSSLTTELAGADFATAGAKVGAQIGKGVADGVAGTGDVLFTALTVPLTKKIANVQVRTTPEAAAAVSTARSVSLPVQNIGPINIDLDINMPDGTTARATATIPAQSPEQLRARAVRRVIAGTRA